MVCRVSCSSFRCHFVTYGLGFNLHYSYFVKSAIFFLRHTSIFVNYVMNLLQVVSLFFIYFFIRRTFQ